MSHKILKSSQNGRYYRRLSRWIRIRCAYNPRKEDLAYYAEDCGDGTTVCDYFTWQGTRYAIGRFYLNSYPESYIEDGEKHYIGGYDSEDYYNPIMIEVDEGGEYVRVYEDVDGHTNYRPRYTAKKQQENKAGRPA